MFLQKKITFFATSGLAKRGKFAFGEEPKVHSTDKKNENQKEKNGKYVLQVFAVASTALYKRKHTREANGKPDWETMSGHIKAPPYETFLPI